MLDKKLQAYYDEIVLCLIKYSDISQIEAQQIIAESKLFSRLNTEGRRNLLFHETPYYWAMHLLYGEKDPQWFQDPKLWPPPAEYLDSDRPTRKKSE